MSVAGMLRQTCSVSRKVPMAGSKTGKNATQQLYPSVRCMVMPMGGKTAIDNGFSLGKAFDFYFADSEDIQTADQLGYNGATYVVKYVKPYSGSGATSYLQALTEQKVA